MNRYENVTDPNVVIRTCVQSMLHASKCHDEKCIQPSCFKMKRVINHTKNCPKKLSAGCSICKQYTALVVYHEKQCSDSKCLVPFCSQVKRLAYTRQRAERKDFKCGMCFSKFLEKEYVRPAALNCGHVICTVCVGKALSAKSTENMTIHCPICTKESNHSQIRILYI